MWRGGWQSSEKRRRRCMSPSALSCGLHSSCRGLPMILFTIFIFRGFLRPKPALTEQTKERFYEMEEMKRGGEGEKLLDVREIDCGLWKSTSNVMWYASFKLQIKFSLFIFCFCLRPFNEDCAAGTEILQGMQTKLDPRYYYGSFQGHCDKRELKYLCIK